MNFDNTKHRTNSARREVRNQVEYQTLHRVEDKVWAQLYVPLFLQSDRGIDQSVWLRLAVLWGRSR